MKKEIKKQQNYPTKPSIKYVRKAHMWVKTTFKDGKQIQEWTITKPN